jgi:hypothetical protein
MYVIKIKYKNEHTIFYANTQIIASLDQITRKQHAGFPISWFSLNLDEAKALYKNLIMRFKSDPYNDEGKTVEYIAIVRLSTYEPYGEYAVIDYKEFK